MNVHRPHMWVVVEITFADGSVQDSVFGGWTGGYLDSEYWRLSSGIVSVKDTGDQYEIENNSGSLYIVKKTSYGISGYPANALQSLIERHQETHKLKVLDGLPPKYLQ